MRRARWTSRSPVGRRWSTRASRSSSSATSVRPAAARTLHRPPWLVRPCVASAVALVHRPIPPPLPHPASARACLSQSCSTTAATRLSSPRWCALACSRRALPLSARPLDSHTRSIGGRPKHMHTRPGARAGDAWRPRRLEELPLRVHRGREAAHAACDTSVVRGRRACAAAASSEGRVPARGCGSLAATACALRDVPCHLHAPQVRVLRGHQRTAAVRARPDFEPHA